MMMMMMTRSMTRLYICMGVLILCKIMTGGEWKLSDESGYLTLNNDWGVVI